MIIQLGHVQHPFEPEQGLSVFQVVHERSYLKAAPIELGVACLKHDTRLTLFISEQPNELMRICENAAGIDMAVESLSSLTNAIDLSQPLSLGTCHIPKPWGQEIWYTGIEERGVCTVEQIPLPYFLEASSLIGASSGVTPILLKILDPVNTEVTGDLYFELHLEKREVYVVTHIDEGAWPDGKGKIRYGFSTTKRNEYSDDQAFAEAYLAAVKAYQRIRTIIDNNPESANMTMLQQESDLRIEMDSFTATRDLNVGDVIRVNPLVPHSLQHGVRVIEFQTPHYERLILSFAQKVLTQSHWDTEEAMKIVDLNPTEFNDHDLVADFEEFTVERISLNPGDSRTIALLDYGVAIVVSGSLRIGNYQVEPEEAVYLAAQASMIEAINGSSETTVFLLGLPRKVTDP